MPQKPAEEAPVRSPDDLLDDYAKLRAARRKEDEGKSASKAALAAMKAAGVDVIALKLAERLEGYGGERAADILQNAVYYARILDIPIGSGQMALDLNGSVPNLTEQLLIKRREIKAEAQGHAAAMNGEPRDNNEHEPGSEEYVAWDRGWRQGNEAKTSFLAEHGIIAANDSAERIAPPDESDAS